MCEILALIGYDIISGIDRLCICSSGGMLYFYQLSEEVPDHSDSMVEGELTPTMELTDPVFASDGVHGDDNVEQSPETLEREIIRCLEILGEQKVIDLVANCKWNYSLPTLEEKEEIEYILEESLTEEPDITEDIEE